ncbi:hypothetical protein CC78DRAFT_540257 [Lojkania enalia]|uniref:Uncharacterized protein n=1 Tax=Lojkania enalia TaxID=147567 RepID=A0A9P4N9Q3_9PLEO|nr:hypothetical protein CC78DRAFT_540257 [Didymosphaeria enalia]
MRDGRWARWLKTARLPAVTATLSGWRAGTQTQDRPLLLARAKSPGWPSPFSNGQASEKAERGTWPPQSVSSDARLGHIPEARKPTAALESIRRPRAVAQHGYRSPDKISRAASPTHTDATLSARGDPSSLAVPMPGHRCAATGAAAGCGGDASILPAMPSHHLLKLVLGVILALLHHSRSGPARCRRCHWPPYIKIWQHEKRPRLLLGKPRLQQLDQHQHQHQRPPTATSDDPVDRASPIRSDHAMHPHPIMPRGRWPPQSQS